MKYQNWEACVFRNKIFKLSIKISQRKYLVLSINILTYNSLFHMVEQIYVKFWEKTMPLGYHLPPDYYRAVPTAITACTVLLVWIILPVLSYNPDLMDPILSDYYEAWADWAKSNVLKMFNFMLWVSFYHFNFYDNVTRLTYII